MIPSPSSPSRPTKAVYDFDNVETKPVEKPKEEPKESDFERWQRQQRELAERREREAEERERQPTLDRQHEQREKAQREERERQHEEKERLERERLQREEKERLERERQEEEQRQREERERRDQERRERMQRSKLERERREREEKELQERLEKQRQDREKQEAERKRKEQEELEQKAKAERERQERERREQQALVEKNKQQEQHRQRLESERERLKIIERERRLLYPDDAAGNKTLDYIESMTEDEVEKEFKRRLEAENRRKGDVEDRRAKGLVSVTRVTYHPDRNDQSERDRRLQMILQEQRLLDKERSRRSEVVIKRDQDSDATGNFQQMREEEERKLREEHREQRLQQQHDLKLKLEEQHILREKENEARRQLQEEQRRRPGRINEPDHVLELKERALKDYERRRILIDQEIARHQAQEKLQEDLWQKEMDEVKTKFDQQKPVSLLKTSNGNKPKKQVSFSQMSTEFREPSSPTYVVESSSGYTAKVTPAASVRLVETRPPAIHTPPDSPLSSPPDSPPESPRDYPPLPRPPPPVYDEYDPPPLPPPPSELLEDDDFPPPPRSAYSDRSSSSSIDPRSPVEPYNHGEVFHGNQSRNTYPAGYGTYPRAARPMSYPTPADLDSIQFNDSMPYSGSNNNIVTLNSGIRETRSLGRINVGDKNSRYSDSSNTPPPIPKKPESMGFKDKMKIFNQDKTPENRVTSSKWERKTFGVNGEVTYT